MKLKTLLKNSPDLFVKGSKEIDIRGLSDHSQTVAPGFLFIAKRGLTHDGSRFIQDAIHAGAVCILSDLFDPFLQGVTQIIHPDIAAVELTLARTFYGESDRDLFLVGITGTNGKTTTSYLVRHLLNGLQQPCGLIGTIEWIVGDHVFPSTQTTPGVIANYKLFREMKSVGHSACVMEVSSHGLDQQRVQGLEFDVAIFTNLTQDHLDYHATMTAYADAKARLFSQLQPSSGAKKSYPKAAIINHDSPFAERMVQDCHVPIITYGIMTPSTLQATHIQLTAQGMDFKVLYQGRAYPFHSQLIGRFNVYNLLAAIGVGLQMGACMEQILPILSSFSQVRGRLERVNNPRSLNVFIDYAHTDDALRNVLEVIREMTPGKIITVFGCGGNRDAFKRPKMGQVAEALSDLVIITNDNPRHEDPQDILNQILSGLHYPQQALVIPDRKSAIQEALKCATPADTVLIAGKGHETYQIFPNGTLHFDDRQEVIASLEA